MIDQKALNDMFATIIKITENLASDIEGHVAKMEDSGSVECFRKAQKIKPHLNEMRAMSDDIRRKYPHLFKEVRR